MWWLIGAVFYTLGIFSANAGSGCGIETPFSFQAELDPDSEGEGCVIPTTKEASQALAKTVVRWKPGPWSPCSKTCGSGEKTRVYYCVTGLEEPECKNNKTVALDCNTHICAGWSGWAEWTASESLDTVRHRVRGCKNVETNEEADNSECIRQYEEDNAYATEIKQVTALPWTVESTPESGGDCLPNCQDECRAIAYNPKNDKCYSGDLNLATPLALANEPNFSWTLTILGDEESSEWITVSEDTNVITIQQACMKNMPLPSVTEGNVLGDMLLSTIPTFPEEDPLCIMAYFKAHNTFFMCTLWNCYTWQFGLKEWTLTHAPPAGEHFAGSASVFADDEETELFITGGRVGGLNGMGGSSRLLFFTLENGFELGTNLGYGGIGMALCRIPNNRILYCGGYNWGSHTACYIYDLASSTTTATGFLPFGDYGNDLALLTDSDGNQFVLLVSGASFHPGSHKFDLATETWSAYGNGHPSYGFIADRRGVVINNKYYISWIRTGGWEGEFLTDELVYDPLVNSWAIQEAIPGDHCEGARARYPFTALIHKNSMEENAIIIRQKGPWSPCSKTCGLGEKTRISYCVTGLEEPECNDNKTETSNCFTQICAGWSGWAEWTTSGTLDTVRHRIRGCKNVDTNDAVDKSECVRQYEEDNGYVTEIKQVTALPWTVESTPASGGDCLPNCQDDCRAIAYNPKNDKCYSGVFDLATPLAYVNTTNSSWTLIIIGDEQSSQWVTVSEDTNILAIRPDCMKNVPLSNVNENNVIGDKLLATIPTYPEADGVFVLAYFKAYATFFMCTLWHCYTWQFGLEEWVPSYAPPNGGHFAGAVSIFSDDEETELFIAGGRAGSTESMSGSNRLLFFTLENGFELGANLGYDGISMALCKIPNNRILYCGGYNWGSHTACYIYDLTSSTTTTTGFLPFGDYANDMALLTDSSGNQFVLLVSGASFHSGSHKFDLATETWSAYGAGHPAYGFIGGNKGIVFDNKYYMFWTLTGGWNGAMLSDELVYDATANTWTIAGAIPGEVCDGLNAMYPFTAFVNINA